MNASRDQAPSARWSDRARADRDQTLRTVVTTFARIALGAAFLSAVASRFGLGGTWDGFEEYAHEVLAFVPDSLVPFLARAATVAELVLGILLVVGVWRRPVAIGAAVLLATFGLAMAISQGIKSPLEYSVFSASAAALLLAVHHERGRVTG